MRWYRVLLAAAASFLATSDSLSASKISNLVASPATLASGNSIVAESTKRRFLRAENPDNADSYSFKDTDHGNDASEVNAAHMNCLEDRGGGAEALAKLKSFQTFKLISRTVSKATNSFSEKISPALPIKSRLQVWSNNGKSVSFVRKELRLDGLDGDALTQAKNFQFYDDYVTSQLPVWANKQLTPDEVVSKLGLHGLSGAALTSNPNFKYYDEFLLQQALVWAKKDVDVDAILVRLGLNTLPAAARPEAVNYKCYEEFVAGLMRSWMEKGVPATEVMAKFKLDKLTGDPLLSHPNYKYYKNYVKNHLKAWVTNGESLDDVAVWLGLENLQGKMLEAHPNFVFLKKYWTTSTKYQEEGMLKQGVTSYDVWNDLQVYRVKPTVRKKSETYKSYKYYVNLIDDYIIDLKIRGFTDNDLPRMTSKDATLEELQEKTFIWTSMRRPEWYVKFSLGLDGLGANALKEDPTFPYYRYYIAAMKAVKHTG